jgi:hypothetical protein
VKSTNEAKNKNTVGTVPESNRMITCTCIALCNIVYGIGCMEQYFDRQNDKIKW